MHIYELGMDSICLQSVTYQRKGWNGWMQSMDACRTLCSSIAGAPPTVHQYYKLLICTAHRDGLSHWRYPT